MTDRDPGYPAGLPARPGARRRARPGAHGGASGAVRGFLPAVGLHRDHRPGPAGTDRGPGAPTPGRVRGRAAGRAGPLVRFAEDRVDHRYAGQHRGQLRPDPWRPAHAGSAHPAADRGFLQRARGGEPVAGGPGRGPRGRLGELFRRARTGGRARPARAPGGHRLPVRRLRAPVRVRTRTRDGRLGASPAGVLGGARRGVRSPRTARGGSGGPAGRSDRRDRPAGRRRDDRRARAPGPDDQAPWFARRARGGLGPAGGPGGSLPAAVARACLRRGVRGRSRRERAGGHPLAGGAVVNTFAAQVGAEVTVVDIGVAAELEPVPGLLPRKIAMGTADFTEGPAMTRDQAVAALTAGIEIARDLVAAGNRCLVTGDMGIANTTASAALICAFTGADPAEATGRGTGIDAAMYARKIEVVCRGLARHRPDPADPVGVLAAFGGFEHGSEEHTSELQS